MKAVVFRSYGPPEQLELVDLPEPPLADDGLLVKVAAAGVNPADWRLRSGQFKRGMRLALPFIPGSDLSGTVVRVGRAAAGFSVGDPVYAMTPLKAGGGYAELAAVPAGLVARSPTGIPLADAAALPLAGLTALQGLRDKGALQPGHRLLVVGGSGGVGHLAIQIGRAMRAEVSAVCGARSFDFVRALGVEQVFDYETDLGQAGRFDVVFDTVAKASFARWGRLLVRGGTLVTVNPIIGHLLPSLVTRLFGVAHLRSFFVQPSGADLATLADMVASGAVRPTIERRFSLPDAADAQRLSQAGHVRGKLVVDVSARPTHE